MSLPSATDYESLIECIRELHSFRDLESLHLWLLDTALPRLIPSDWLSYNEVDLLHPEKTRYIVKPESDGTLQRLIPRFNELAYQHPLITGSMQANDFPVHKISDFMTRPEYHELE